MCLLVSPVFILRFGTRLRAVIIAALLVITPLIVVFVNPTEPSLLVLKRAIFGEVRGTSVFSWPLVPWFAIFLTGSFVGQALGRLRQGSLDVSTLEHELNRVGIALAVCSVILTLGYKLLKITFGMYSGGSGGDDFIGQSFHMLILCLIHNQSRRK